jgi:two-component system, NarL family, nitrate/nitrite response regulator NarL
MVPFGRWIAPVSGVSEPSNDGGLFSTFLYPSVRERSDSIEVMAKNQKLTRVLLIGDHAAIHAGLRMLIESRPGLRVVGEEEDYANAPRAVALEKPDIVLLGLSFCPQDKCLNLLPELLSASRQSRIILLTNARDTETLQRAMDLGAMGVVHWERVAAELVKAIEKVHAGELWLGRSLTARIIISRSRFNENKTFYAGTNRISSLTVREREVGALVGEGLRNSEIAHRLFISETTVRHHLRSIFSKLDVSNRLEFMVFLCQHNVATPKASTLNRGSVGRVH